MKDFLGNELEVGDEVVFMQINYRSLVKGVVDRFTPQKVWIWHEKLNIGGKETLQDPSQVVKICQ